MKKLLLFILFITTTLKSVSQSVSIPSVDSKEYEAMKKNGHVAADLKFTHPKTFTPTLEDLHRAGAIVHSMPASGVCGCYRPSDTSYTLAMVPNDDGSTDEIPIPFTFCLYGMNWNLLYINNNGNVSFGSSYIEFSSSSFPSADFAMLAPFWADVDTRGLGTVKYKITPTAIYINWDAVGYYPEYTDKVNTFRLIITDGIDPILPPGNNVAFCYGDMQWTTGDASGGAGGFGGTPTTVGVNGGDGVENVQIGRFNVPGAYYDGGYALNDGVDWLDNKSLYFNSCNGTNIAPISSINPPLSGDGCDTLRVCGMGDTLLISTLFLAPELEQTTSITIDLSGTPGATVIRNDTGNAAAAVVRIIATPLAAGDHVFTFVATDNGTPPQSTTIDIHVFIDTSGFVGPDPYITGNAKICEGGNLMLHVDPDTYNAYSWSTGSHFDSTIVHSEGVYWVTAREGICSKTTSVLVNTNPLPAPQITGPLFVCSDTATTLTLESASNYTHFSWSNASTNDSISVLSGIYIVSVTDTNGCKGSDTVHVLNTIPLVSISGTAHFCSDANTNLTADPTFLSGADYIWSNADTTQTIIITTAGLYTIRVNYNNGCFATDSVFVSEYEAPHANFNTSPSGTTTALNTVTLTDLSTIASGIITLWNWNFGDGSTSETSALQNPSHVFAADGTYRITLTVQSNNGCWDTTRFDYVVASDVMIPNVFTPNNDGKNDYLAFKNLEFFPGTSLTVYNRWGEKVYSNPNYHNDWDGGGHNDGVYYFVLIGPSLKETKYGFVQLIK